MGKLHPEDSTQLEVVLKRHRAYRFDDFAEPSVLGADV